MQSVTTDKWSLLDLEPSRNQTRRGYGVRNVGFQCPWLELFPNQPKPTKTIQNQPKLTKTNQNHPNQNQNRPKSTKTGQCQPKPTKLLFQSSLSLPSQDIYAIIVAFFCCFIFIVKPPIIKIKIMIMIKTKAAPGTWSVLCSCPPSHSCKPQGFAASPPHCK